MSSHLWDLVSLALERQKAGDIEGAVELYEQIIQIQPDMDHGLVLYSLAGCYEDLGKIEAAEQAYRQAVLYEPYHPILVGGLASHLYLYGDPQEALETYQKLIEIASANKDENDLAAAETAIQALRNRIALAEQSSLK